MSKSAAKRELLALVGKYKPWDRISDADQAEINRLKTIAYPTGIPLPRI